MSGGACWSEVGEMAVPYLATQEELEWGQRQASPNTVPVQAS